MDRCRGHSNAKKRYKCFKRNWNLFKPHRQNKLNDLRSRTARACWKYKNNILKRAKCFAKHTRDYKGELYKGLLADDIENKDKTQKKAEGENEEGAKEQKPVQAAAEKQEEGEEQEQGEDDNEVDAEGEEEENLVAIKHVNERELSSASSTDSEESSTSSDDTSDDNNHKAKTPTNQKLASGERRAGRRERLANLKESKKAGKSTRAAAKQ